jgi:transcriptional regulator with XRE-family HTH domain
MVGTLRRTFAGACLETRIGLDLTQQQVADRVGVSRSYIAKVEAGGIDPDLSMTERIAEALGLQVQLVTRPPIFPAGGRVLDAVHARCSAYVDRRLRNLGFETAREVEIVHGRSHGWIDLLAFDRRTGTLFVIEIKTRLDDLGALERQLGWYERMAWQPGRVRGWQPRRVLSLVLALASDEVDAVVRAHRDLIRIAFPFRAADLVTDPSSAGPGARGLALVDPASRRRNWLIRTSIDGRRSRLPYRGYRDVVRPAAESIARAPLVTNEPSEPRPMNVKPISSSGGRPAAS